MINDNNANYTRPSITEVFYAAADAIASSRNDELSVMLKHRISSDIQDDKIRYLLSDDDVEIKITPPKDKAIITLKDKTISSEARLKKLLDIKEALTEAA